MRPDIPQKSGIVPSNNEDRSPLVDKRESVTSEVSRPSCNRAASVLRIALSVGVGSLIATDFNTVAQATESVAKQEVSAGEPIVLEDTVTEPIVASATSVESPAEDQPVEVPDTASKAPVTQRYSQVAVSLAPKRISSAPALNTQSTAIAKPQSDGHAVRKGETLWQIAQTYKVDVRALANVNQLSTGSVLRVGQVLSLPSNTAPKPVKGVVRIASLAKSLPELPELASSDDVNEVGVKARQADAVDELRAKRDQLKRTMAELGEESSEVVTNQSDAELSVTDLSKEVLPSIGGRELDGQADAVQEAVVAADTAQPEPQPTEFNPQPLLAEIRNLRNRYNDRPVAKVTVTPKQVAVIANAKPVQPELTAAKLDDAEVQPLSRKVAAANPDFADRKSESALSIELRNFVQPKLKPDVKDKVKSAPTANRQVVARATLGASAYAPVTPAVKKMVAPNLPTIGSEDAYLPGTKLSRGYVWPAKGLLSSGYGPRWGRMHRGIDIAAPVGTPIVASAAGKVSYARWNNGGYGYLVEVEHADGTMTRYAHNNRILVKEGQQVAQGQQIAEMGSTGFSTGPHLHFEIHPRGRGAINPIAMLNRRS